MDAKQTPQAEVIIALERNLDVARATLRMVAELIAFNPAHVRWDIVKRDIDTVLEGTEPETEKPAA